VALAVKLRLAKDAVADDPDDAEAMIDEVRGDLQQAIAELRSLAHGIFPPLLMSGGLTEALPAAASRAALTASTEFADVARHSPEVEAAVYFCCSEALQNAGKHAGSEATAHVHVWQTETALHWEVVDDGPGFDASAVAGSGHGFVNMRDRMGSFGGTLEVLSAPGTGTTIRGHVPLS
jgi:signal transduction histidine kinase